MVDRWWSTKPHPPANELRKFMAKIVKLGYAIGNDNPTDSSQYQIQILGKCTDNTDKASTS